ncbi:DNA-binding transcriptional LysR family regulator [Brevundimonas nasdae]|uniref:LysR family transcriptional regulator n=1 Tax=Brevundimonas nasdae TaxID=172043 RepID=UPI001913AE44|nr:LysR family transcriptional regulator [Brevundimonas nasdae]MBK6024440.1 LysR family transcriptional regulator [Brevundimonas nasdae]MDQ0451098.1 DNA-binding transcriptional LysR family regulator [Brevundimonas nasdae]
MQTNGADRARELEVFAAVAQSGSFSAAGRALGLTPSAVSRTIDRIEARLGVRLMLRTTRVLTLTAEGQAYQSAARRILADLDDAEQSIADQGAPRGRIRVSAALAHGRLVVVPLLGEFVRLFPHILVDINLTDAVVDVAAGQADVAIRFGPLADSPLTARRLGETGRIIVASPEYLARRGVPQVPEDLLDHDCLNFNFRRTEPVWPFRRDGRDYALTVRGSVEANNGETLTQLAMDGVGVTRVGAFSVGDAVESGRLVPLLEAFNPGDREPIHAVFVGGANMPARVRVFVDFLAEHLR